MGEEGDSQIFLLVHCHHKNDSCIKIGDDEIHFNVSLIVRDKVTRQCPQTTTFLKRRESQSRNHMVYYNITDGQTTINMLDFFCVCVCALYYYKIYCGLSKNYY